jgi:spermidine synthase
VRTELGFTPGDDVDVRVDDARLTLAERPTDSADVVIGDAFGGRAVPWHLTTREFVAEIGRVLRPGGIYAANIIDNSRQRFLRAEAATVARVLPHVAVILGPGAAAGRGGNSVIVASDEPLDEAALAAELDTVGEGGRVVADIDAHLDGALVLTDDHAPVDQLLAGGL